MKFSLAASTLGLAALALAAPADIEARTGGWGGGGGGGSGGGGGGTNNCPSTQQAVCCTGESCYVSQGKKNGAGNTVNCGSNSATVKCCNTNSSPVSVPINPRSDPPICGTEF